MGWTAPHKASRCRRVIVEDESPERAVHDNNYHHRARPCKEGVPSPRRRFGGQGRRRPPDCGIESRLPGNATDRLPMRFSASAKASAIVAFETTSSCNTAGAGPVMVGATVSMATKEAAGQ